MDLIIEPLRRYFFNCILTVLTVSGEETTDPVLSPKSRMIFDRKLLETYITKNGKDPITNDLLSIKELIPIRTSLDDLNGKPLSVGNDGSQPSIKSSIPSLLSVFQNEWDSLILENFELKKKIHQLQNDLSSSVYHYDASIRVISRITKERDEAIKKLQDTLLNTGSTFANTNDRNVNKFDQPESSTSSVNSITKSEELVKPDNTSMEEKLDKMDIDINEETTEIAAQHASEEVPTTVDQSQANESSDMALPQQDATMEAVEKEKDPLEAIADADKFLSNIHQKQLKDHKSTLNTMKSTLLLKTLFPFTAFDQLSIPTSNALSENTISNIFNYEILLVSNKTHVFILNLSSNSILTRFKISSVKRNAELFCTDFVNVNTVAKPFFKPVLGFDDGSAVILDIDLSKPFTDTPNAGKTIRDSIKIPIIELPPAEAAAALVKILIHPSLNNFLIEIFSNGIWRIIDCFSRKAIFTSNLDSGSNFEYSIADLHMDGSLLAIGTTNGLIMIYDLKSGDKLTTFQETFDEVARKDDLIINNLVFANNGYWLLSTLTSLKEQSSRINIWDLRKGEITTSINCSKIIKKVAIDKFSQILTILFFDDSVEFFKYLKKTKQWVQDNKLSSMFFGFLMNNNAEGSAAAAVRKKKSHLINIYWQKTFDRTFYVVKDSGHWGKFAIDFD